jgi:hypothetical protein
MRRAEESRFERMGERETELSDWRDNQRETEKEEKKLGRSTVVKERRFQG